MQPPAWPRTEADLADWSVYADHLLVGGDPRGEIIARELALSATPADEELASVRALIPSAPTPHVHRVFSLGHVAHVHVTPNPTAASVLAIAAIGRASPFAELAIVVRPEVPLAIWRALFARLPTSCTRVELAVFGALDAEVVSALPDTVRELAISEPVLPERVVSDRFDRVEILHHIADEDYYHRVASALAQTSRVRVRTWLAPAGAPSHPRLELGEPGDGLVHFAAHTLALRRWRLTDLSPVYGYVPIRMRLARTLPEWFSFSYYLPRYHRSQSSYDAAIVRTPAGWHQLPRIGESTAPIPLAPGSAGVILDQPFTFSLA